MSTYGFLSSFNHSVDTWSTYNSRLTQWFIANDIELTEETETKRRAILLSAIGQSTYQLLTILVSPLNLETLSYEEIIKVLDNHFTPKRHGFSDRHKFYSAVQLPGETCHQWADRLRGLVERCGFSNVEEALRDRFVMGSIPGPVRERLYELNLDHLSLTDTIDFGECVRCAREATAAVHMNNWVNQGVFSTANTSAPKFGTTAATSGFGTTSGFGLPANTPPAVMPKFGIPTSGFGFSGLVPAASGFGVTTFHTAPKLNMNEFKYGVARSLDTDLSAASAFGTLGLSDSGP